MTHFTPPPSNSLWATSKIAPVDPSVRPVDKPRLTGQNAQVLNRLRQGPLNAMQAHDMGIMRLAARILDVKRAGYQIESKWVGSIAEYRLVNP